MLGRFSPLDLFRGHGKVLSDYSDAATESTHPDWWSRAILIAVPVGVGLFMGFKGTLSQGALLLTAMALLAGGFLSAFTHLSTLRLRLSDREDTWGNAERFDRDALDETATHLLAAAYVAALTGLVLAVRGNFSHGVPLSVLTGVASAGVTYTFLVFLIVIPRLYAAYESMNRVRRQMSGSFRETNRRS